MTRLGPLLVAGMIVVAGGTWALVRLDTVDQQARRETAFRLAQDTYSDQVRAYDKSVTDRALCIDGVARSDNNRSQWEQLANIIANLPSANAAAYAEQLREGPLLASEPRVVADCPAALPTPVPPARTP